MRTLAASTIVCVFITAAQAQDQVVFTWDWVTVEAGTSNVIAPAIPGMVSPGEGVEFRGSLVFGPQVGSVRCPTNAPCYMISGLGRIVADFQASAGHGGVFHAEVMRQPAVGAGPFIMADRIREIRVGQPAVNGTPLTHTSNSFPDAIITRWTPSNYAPRVVTFELARSPTVPFAAELWADVSGGSGPPVYMPYAIENANFFGGSVQVQVIPVPASAAVVCFGAAVALRRRR
jgi:hypothetical protein